MNKEKKDTYNYKGWLTSDSIIKRSFASLGYQMLATLMIYGGILAVGLFFMGLSQINN